MRKILCPLALAIIVLSVSSCAKDDGISIREVMNGTIDETSLDGTNALFWGEGASFSYFPESVDNIKYEILAGTRMKVGKFATEMLDGAISGKTLSANVAISPYNSAATVSMDGDLVKVSTSVPEEQSFSTSGFYDSGMCPLVSVSGRKSDDISFRSPYGAVAIKIKGAAIITKIEFEANGGEVLNGKLEVTVDKDNEIRSVNLTGGSSKLTLNSDPGIQLAKTPKDFVVFIPAGNYSKGFTITSYSSEGDAIVTNVDQPITLERAELATIASKQFIIYIDLNEKNPDRANCYVISKPGSYCFDATVKGNGAEGIHETFKNKSTEISPDGAKLIWEEEDGLVTDLSVEDGKIYFTCSGKDGNALIGATDKSGNVIWSWHIWSTSSELKSIALGQWTFLDRNVGASSPDERGMYYQWGRKDPFSRKIGFQNEKRYHPVEGGAADNPNAKNTIEYSVAHPNAYLRASGLHGNDWLVEQCNNLWGISFPDDGLLVEPYMKTIYDPCPSGYVVATAPSVQAGIDGGMENKGSYCTLFGGQLTIPTSGFIFNTGSDWWNPDSEILLWTSSTAWGNTDYAFQFWAQFSTAYSGNERALGEPVRCIKLVKE